MGLIKKLYTKLIFFLTKNKLQKQAIEQYNVFVDDFPFDCVVAGGTLRDYFFEKEINKNVDVDVFFLSEEEINKAKNWLDTVINGNSIVRRVIGNVEYYKHPDFDVTFNFVFFKIYKNAQEIIDSFDFTVCAVAIHQNKIYFNSRFFRDLYDRKITVINLEKMTSVLYRLSKYKEKGFEVERELIEKIFDYNRKNPEKLFRCDDGYGGKHTIFDINRACGLLGIKRICLLKRSKI